MLEAGVDCCQQMSQISSQFSYFALEYFLITHQRKSVLEIKSVTEEGNFVVFAKVIEIEKARDWYYDACKRCIRKINQVGNSYFCDHYQMNVWPIVQRFVSFQSCLFIFIN